MAQHREITLRNVKGTALTYAEMDQNLSSFFYSASLSSTNLLLHYTGSTTLGAAYTPASITVPLNPLLATIQQLTVAGNLVGDIQYRIDSSTLGANSVFKWDTVNSRLGVGVATPVATLHIDSPGKTTPTTLRINTRLSGTKVATLDYYIGNVQVGTVGKAVGNTEDMYTIVSNGANSAYTQIGSTKVVQISSLGQGIFTTPNTELTVKGVIGVGTDTGANQGLLGNIITPQYPQGRVLESALPTLSTSLGLLIESPKKLSGAKITGGHVVIGVNSITTNQKYAFSVLTNNTTGIYSTPLLTVQANGKTGINNANPVEALDIVGNTTMTGNINVAGEATISGSATILGNATISGNAQISQTLNVGTDITFSGQAFQRAARKYTANINLPAETWVPICTVSGDQLASAIRLSIQGTSTNVVIDVLADIVLTHDYRIAITSTTAPYTQSQPYLRVVADSVNSYTLEALYYKTVTGITYDTSTNVSIEIFPYNSETVVFGGTAYAPTNSPKNYLEYKCSFGSNIDYNSSVSTTIGHIQNSPIVTVTSKSFASGQNNTSGYHVFNTGLIIQWGQVSSNGNGGAEFNLPIVYPNRQMSCVASTLRSNPGASGYNHTYNLTAHSFGVVKDGGTASYISMGY